jgi:uncharacterized repeat protein (TIGR03803 family)
MKRLTARTRLVSLLGLLVLLPSVQTAQAQTETAVYGFCSISGCYDGAFPSGSLTADRYGNFYGTTQFGGIESCAINGDSCVGGAVFQLSPEPAAGCPSGFTIGNGWCETVLYNFCSAGAWPDCTDGETPHANLTLVPPSGHYSTSVGTFYGTTYSGGTGSGCTDSGGCGIAFELTPEPLPFRGCPSGSNLGNGWCETVLYHFCSLAGCADGTYPASALVRDSAGNLYGTVPSGVYELYEAGGVWYEAMIYSVETNSGGLAIDAAGSLYGADANQHVFKLSRDSSGYWFATNIHTFTGPPKDAYDPFGTPVVDSAGNVYGTTAIGGAGTTACATGCGTVWKLIPLTTGKTAGTYTERILHSFTSEKTGYYPEAGVTLDSSGNIYGTTMIGGKYSTQCQDLLGSGCGTVFKLAKTDLGYAYKLLWSFNSTDGAFPFDNPVLDSSGNLYGTTYEGGAVGGGAVFEVKP